MNHHDAGPTAPPLGCRVQGLSTGDWAQALHGVQSTALHSRRQCIAMHSPHTYTRTREKFCYENCFGIFRILSREGGDLDDEILSQKTWKNERKLGENVVFWAFSWKMVKYFIEILSYFGKNLVNFQVKIADFLSKMGYFVDFLSIFINFELFLAHFHLFSAIFSQFWIRG